MKSFQQMLQVIVLIIILLVGSFSCFTQTYEYQCNNTTHNYQDTLRTVSSRLLKLHGPFDASKSQFASEACRRDVSAYLTSLNNLELWALRMYDSSAKMPSGILSGNINQFGDYDECMQSQYDDNQQLIEPQYCLASLQPEIIDGNAELKRYSRIIQSNYMFASNFNDPRHIFPQFSSINWAICVPTSCTYQDVEQVLIGLAANLTNGTGIDLKVRVDKEMCQRSSYKVSLGTTLEMAIAAIFLLICVFSTIYDFKTKIQNPWFVVFSIRKNTKFLFSLERAPDDIKSIHGVRFFFMIMLYIGHKMMATSHVPFTNRVGLSEIASMPWAVLMRAMFLYTDPFLMISGLLATYSFVGRLQKGNDVQIKREYISRLLRIMPPILVTLYLVIFSAPYFVFGPLRHLFVTHNMNICKNHWWKNLLFIQNYFGIENMCLAHTHHIATDTQLFVLVPFMSLLLWKYPKAGAVFLIGIAGFSSAGRYLITIHKRLNYLVHYGISIQTVFDSFNYMYIIPPFRITVYIMGVFLGYLLRIKRELKFTQSQLKIGWFINIVLLMAAIAGPAPMSNMNYQYSPTGAAQYATFAPIALCSFLGWVIFTSHLGYSTILSRFFSWKGFLITTRISYAVYLVQLLVFFWNVTKIRHSGYFNLITTLTNVYEMSQILMASILLTVLFEIPFGNINKILFPTKYKVLNPNSKQE